MNDLKKIDATTIDLLKQYEFELEQCREIALDHCSLVSQFNDDAISYISGNTNYPECIDEFIMNSTALVEHLKEYKRVESRYMKMKQVVSMIESEEKNEKEGRDA